MPNAAKRTYSHSGHPLHTFLRCAAAGLLLLLTPSCSDDDPYPSIISEIAEISANSQGYITRLILDDGTSYKIANAQAGFKPNSRYRVLCGYVPNGDEVQVYQLTGVYVLRDSTGIAKHAPTNVRSTWRTQRYINLHLAAMTQGGTQYWGFCTDSVTSRVSADGDTLSHAYLSLHHDQNGDPTSYTDEVYVSIPLDSIRGIRRDSHITLSISTFDGKREIEF